jgi:hypothetical protein
MADTISARRFALQWVDQRTWLITDIHNPGYGAHPLGRIIVTDDDQVEVTWDAPVPLPVLYSSLEDVIESLEEWAHRPRGATKPIPIPHFPPPAH